MHFRWKETDWANHNIISRLLDVMRDSGKDETSGAIKEDLLTWVVDTIGYVSRYSDRSQTSGSIVCVTTINVSAGQCICNQILIFMAVSS